VSLGVLSLFILFQSLKQKANDEESEAQASWRGRILCLISLLVFILLLETLGFIPTSFVFIGFYIKVIERKGWVTAILTALAIAMASYGLFEICLQSQLPKGILEVLGI
jgi:putative tricarboxylic transport membrane protein